MSAVMTDSLQPEEHVREPLTLRVLRAVGKTLAPEDGWLTIALLVVVVYITIASIQSANPPWVPGKMHILSYFAVAGMALGYLVVQLRRVPESVTHPIAIAFGVVFAYQQTASAEFPKNPPETLFTSRYRKGEVVRIPIAHGDGNYFADAATLDQLEGEGRVVFRYVDAGGDATPEANPNGAQRNIAGICDPTRRILGMMPHPERCSEALLGNADGLGVFKSIAASLARV